MKAPPRLRFAVPQMKRVRGAEAPLVAFPSRAIVCACFFARCDVPIFKRLFHSFLPKSCRAFKPVRTAKKPWYFAAFGFDLWSQHGVLQVFPHGPCTFQCTWSFSARGVSVHVHVSRAAIRHFHPAVSYCRGLCSTARRAQENEAGSKYAPGACCFRQVSYRR